MCESVILFDGRGEDERDAVENETVSGMSLNACSLSCCGDKKLQELPANPGFEGMPIRHCAPTDF